MTDERSIAVDGLLESLRQWRTDALDTVDVLRTSRRQIEEQTKQLEGPQAALEYIDFFIELFATTAADLDRLTVELPRGLQAAHADVLRQIASNAGAEQRRCLMFRDKWINRPLPYEQMRPLLNQISTDTRDQLADFRKLNDAATLLASFTDPEPKAADDGKLDRRALFTRWFGR